MADIKLRWTVLLTAVLTQKMVETAECFKDIMVALEVLTLALPALSMDDFLQTIVDSVRTSRAG